MTISSAAGLLALLSEQNDELKRYALTNLDKARRTQIQQSRSLCPAPPSSGVLPLPAAGRARVLVPDLGRYCLC